MSNINILEELRLENGAKTQSTRLSGSAMPDSNWLKRIMLSPYLQELPQQ